MAVAKPVSWQELGRRTLRETLDDDCLGLAAQLSYCFFLSLFPAPLFLVALASFFQLAKVTDDVKPVLGSLLSPEIITLVQEQMRRLAEAPHGGMATVGLLGAFWSSSAAIVAIVTAVNRAYDLTDTRPWWRIRLTAIVLTLLLGLVIVVALALLLTGPGLASLLGLPAESVVWSRLWNIARWPMAFAILAGGVAVLLLWICLSGLGLLVGAELNSEFEHAARALARQRRLLLAAQPSRRL